MSDNREIEAKFVADGPTLDALLTLDRAGEYSILQVGTKQQDDLYYDTSEQHLRRAGSSLRIRRKSPDAEMTFKGDRVVTGGAVSRLEDEVNLPAEAVAKMQWDGALDLAPAPSPLQRAREITGTDSLLPTARLQTSRTILIVSSEHGAEVELAVDRCVAERLADGRKIEFEEVEAELKQGSVDDLHQVTRALTNALPGLAPASLTKLQRALD